MPDAMAISYGVTIEGFDVLLSYFSAQLDENNFHYTLDRQRHLKRYLTHNCGVFYQA
jgi:hypothetical protein